MLVLPPPIARVGAHPVGAVTRGGGDRGDTFAAARRRRRPLVSVRRPPWPTPPDAVGRTSELGGATPVRSPPSHARALLAMPLLCETGRSVYSDDCTERSTQLERS